MRNAFLCIAVAAALAAPAMARDNNPVPIKRSTVMAPSTVEVPRNTLITSTRTYKLNADGSVKTREVASNTKAKGKLKYRTY